VPWARVHRSGRMEPAPVGISAEDALSSPGLGQEVQGSWAHDRIVGRKRNRAARTEGQDDTDTALGREASDLICARDESQ
jgi:hypothetical protein